MRQRQAECAKMLIFSPPPLPTHPPRVHSKTLHFPLSGKDTQPHTHTHNCQNDSAIKVNNLWLAPSGWGGKHGTHTPRFGHFAELSELVLVATGVLFNLSCNQRNWAHRKIAIAEFVPGEGLRVMSSAHMH